jgi:putative two-component system response regulator
MKNNASRQNVRADWEGYKLDTVTLKSLAALVDIWEAKNDYICGHSQKVAQIATEIARALTLCPSQVSKIRSAGLLHDIGNIGIREEILNKPSGLSVAEYQVIKSHCELGERLLAMFLPDEEILSMVRYHHERYDGSGYPDGLAGEQIILGARVLAIADAYDAMTSDRPYRPGMSGESACSRLEQGRGTQFDPAVVTAFFGSRAGASQLGTHTGDK